MNGTSSLANQLCLDCGLCCDGTIFGFIELTDNEQASLNETAAKIEKDRSGARLLFPCAMLDGTACTIYRTRPSGCVNFNCKVLDQLGSAEIDETEARRRIAGAKAAAAQAAGEYHAGETAAEARYRWFALNRDSPDPIHSRFNLLMTALNLLLDRHFRWPDRRRVEFDLNE